MPAPTRARCWVCTERIQRHDRGEVLAGDGAHYETAADGTIVRCESEGGINAVHYECQIRMAVGSVSHQQRRCSCFGGDDAHEQGLSMRESALAAEVYFRTHQPVLFGVDADGADIDGMVSQL